MWFGFQLNIFISFHLKRFAHRIHVESMQRKFFQRMSVTQLLPSSPKPPVNIYQAILSYVLLWQPSECVHLIAMIVLCCFQKINMMMMMMKGEISVLSSPVPNTIYILPHPLPCTLWSIPPHHQSLYRFSFFPFLPIPALPVNYQSLPYRVRRLFRQHTESELFESECQQSLLCRNSSPSVCLCVCQSGKCTQFTVAKWLNGSRQWCVLEALASSSRLLEDKELWPWPWPWPW